MFYSKKCWVLLGSANASLSLRYNPAYKSEGLLFLSTQNLAEKQQKNGPSWPLSLDFSRLPHYGVGAGRLVTPYNKIYEQCKRPTCVCPTYLWRSLARVRGNFASTRRGMCFVTDANGWKVLVLSRSSTAFWLMPTNL